MWFVSIAVWHRLKEWDIIKESLRVSCSLCKSCWCDLSLVSCCVAFCAIQLIQLQATTWLVLSIQPSTMGKMGAESKAVPMLTRRLLPKRQRKTKTQKIQPEKISMRCWTACSTEGIRKVKQMQVRSLRWVSQKQIFSFHFHRPDPFQRACHK